MIEGKRRDLWSTPIWELQTEFDDEFNNKLLLESNNPDLGNYKNIWGDESECIQIMKTYIKQVVGSIDPTLSLGNGWFYKSNINESLPVHHHVVSLWLLFIMLVYRKIVVIYYLLTLEGV